MLTKIKLAADIAEVASKIYATVVDKSRDIATKNARIKALETELAALKAKAGTP